MAEIDDDGADQEEYEYLPLIVLAGVMALFYGVIIWVISSQDKQRGEALKKGN